MIITVESTQTYVEDLVMFIIIASFMDDCKKYIFGLFWNIIVDVKD